MSSSSIVIRPFQNPDLSRVAYLCGELGYPYTEMEMIERLPQVTNHPDHELLVAEMNVGGAPEVVGWVHVYSCPSLASANFAHIGGLVVDSLHRGNKIGEGLMSSAEEWARLKKLAGVRLYSRLIREDAHRFYKRLGYELTKTSVHFAKAFR